MSSSARVRGWLIGSGGVGLAVAGLGLVWVLGAAGINSTTNFIGLGPAVMVRAVGGVLLVLGLLLAASGWWGAPTPRVPDEAATPARRGPLGLAFAALLLPPLTIQWLGFPLVAMLVFALVTRAFGSRRPGLDLALGAGLSLLAWWGFSGLGIALGPLLPLTMSR